MFPPAKVHQRSLPAWRREWRQAMTRSGVSSGSLHAANVFDGVERESAGCCLRCKCCACRGSTHSVDCLSIGIDQLAGLELAGPDHDLARHVLELAHAVAADVLELRIDDARRLPFAVLAERHRSDHRVDAMIADVIGERLSSSDFVSLTALARICPA